MAALPGYELVSHWNTFIDGLSFSPKTFYEYLKGVIESREIKGLKIDMTEFAEGGVLSSRRLYLRVRHLSLIYYICAAPYGQGFFVSSWLIERRSIMKRLIFGIPFIGNWLDRLFFPVTFYTIDTTNMYLTVIHDSIVRTTNHIAEEGGHKPIAEADSKPIMRDLFKR